MTTATAPVSTDLVVRPVAGRLGAVIEGVDLAGDLPDDVVAGIRAALVRHRVVFFRDQDLAPDRQLAFSSRLGPLTLSHPNRPAEEAASKLLELENTRANHWHSDVSFIDRPPFASILAHVSTPPYGADTAWASTVAAYEALPEPLRRLADSIDVVHSNVFDYANLSGSPEEQARLASYFGSNPFETVHPAVRVIEETGERALYLGGFATRIVGLSPRQSRTVLDLLQDQVTHIENTVRWQWRPGDVVIWDNRSTQHTAVDDLESYAGRHLRRVTVAGDLPVGPDGRRSRSIHGDSSSYTPRS